MQDLARYEKVRLGKIWQLWQDMTRKDLARLGKI